MTTNHDHNTQMDALDEAFLEDKCYRACIDQLIGTAAINAAANVDSKKMYARVLLEVLLAEDVTLEAIFHPNIIKDGHYHTQPDGMMDVLQRSRLEKDYLKDKTSHWDKNEERGEIG